MASTRNTGTTSSLMELSVSGHRGHDVLGSLRNVYKYLSSVYDMNELIERN